MRGREADLAAIEKLRQQDIAATVARDPDALTDFWTDDAIRLGVGAPPEIGKKIIRASNERQMSNKHFKVLSYEPETRDICRSLLARMIDRKSTRLNSSHSQISYA